MKIPRYFTYSLLLHNVLILLFIKYYEFRQVLEFPLNWTIHDKISFLIFSFNLLTISQSQFIHGNLQRFKIFIGIKNISIISKKIKTKLIFLINYSLFVSVNFNHVKLHNGAMTTILFHLIAYFYILMYYQTFAYNE